MKWLTRPTVVLLMCAGLTLPGIAQSAGTTWNVAVGGDTADHSVQAQDFFPRTITISAGDSIEWTWTPASPHTVTFLPAAAKPPIPFGPRENGKMLFNPQVAFPQGGKSYEGNGMASSGFVQGRGKTYTLTFTKPGRYAYQCLLHPGMTGFVIVQPKDKHVPMTQAEYDSAAQKQLAQELHRGQQLLESSKPAVSKGDKGTIHTIPLVGATEARASGLRFGPEPITVKAGDTVRWVMKDPFEIHTITFAGTEQPPEFIIPEQQPQGPPKLYFNPKAAAPAGGTVHKGDGYYNSGIIFSPIMPGPKTYSLTFTKPGTYNYWCVVHIPEGMKGTIIVK